jgi:chorismate mutase
MMQPVRHPLTGSRFLQALAIAGALFFTALLGSCTTSPAAPSTSETEAFDRLLILMKGRLEIALPVARDKWNRGAAIEDAGREQAVIDAAVAQALQHGMQRQAVERFFRAQITAGKMIQAALFEQWKLEKQGKFRDVPDLARQIRPELDRLTAALLLALDQAGPMLARPDANPWMLRRTAAITSDMPSFNAAWPVATQPLIAAPDQRSGSGSGLPK